MFRNWRLRRQLKKFERTRVRPGKWCRYPPTRRDVYDAHDGYFWVKYPVMDGKLIMDIIVKVVQINHLMSSGDEDDWDVNDVSTWPLVAHGMYGKWAHGGRIENPELIRELFTAGYEWQTIRPPRKLPVCP